MATHTIRMPDIGEGIAEVEIVDWRVNVGDEVHEDQVLCDVMTDKAAVEIPSPVAGRVLERGGDVGQVLAVGAVLLRIDTGAGAAGTAEVAATAAPLPSPDLPTPPPPAVTMPASGPREPAAVTPVPSPAGGASPRPLAAPAVRERARALGMELGSLRGSGADGRVVHADLDEVLQRGARAPSAASGPLEGRREVKLVGLRRAIAQKMQISKRQIPHYTYVEEVDVTEMVALRDALNREHGAARGELSPLALAIRAIVRAVVDFPQVNARFDDEAGVLTLHEAVHLGVATQTDNGLMVPVLRQAQALDLWQSAQAIAELATRARAGKATREELTGSTLTVTSLGKLGGIVSTPVINHPEVAIVGINRIVARPVVREGRMEVRQMMNLSSSFDHRVVDGAVAAGYIQRVRQLLEAPGLLFVG